MPCILSRIERAPNIEVTSLGTAIIAPLLWPIGGPRETPRRHQKRLTKRRVTKRASKQIDCTHDSRTDSLLTGRKGKKNKRRRKRSRLVRQVSLSPTTALMVACRHSGEWPSKPGVTWPKVKI